MQIMKRLAHKKQKKALALVSAPCFFVSGMQSCLHYRQHKQIQTRNNEVEEQAGR